MTASLARHLGAGAEPPHHGGTSTDAPVPLPAKARALEKGLHDAQGALEQIHREDQAGLAGFPAEIREYGRLALEVRDSSARTCARRSRPV